MNIITEAIKNRADMFCKAMNAYKCISIIDKTQ